MWGSVAFSCTSPSQISQYFLAKAMSCTPDDSDASCNHTTWCYQSAVHVKYHNDIIIIILILPRKPLMNLSEDRLHKPGSASDFRRKPTTWPHSSEKVCPSGLPKASEGDDWPDRWKDGAAELRATNNDDFIQTFRLWRISIQIRFEPPSAYRNGGRTTTFYRTWFGSRAKPLVPNIACHWSFGLCIIINNPS